MTRSEIETVFKSLEIGEAALEALIQFTGFSRTAIATTLLGALPKVQEEGGADIKAEYDEAKKKALG